MALRVENNVRLVILPWSPTRMFTGRYAIQRGKNFYPPRWKADVANAFCAEQQQNPVSLLSNGTKTLWYFHDSFYWDDDGLDRDDVKALVLQRERRLQKKLQTAHSLMRAEGAGRPTRVPIPADLRRAVFERDVGRCVECGSNFDLQYDHILPVALGGATTVDNLQILCANCNRLKSDTI